MFIRNHTRGLGRNLFGVAGACAIAACSSSAPESNLENTGIVPGGLLVAACDTTGGNLTLTLAANEVGYVGRTAGCTVEPCVFANAVTSTGAICRVNSSGKTVTVTGAVGVEKMVVDYSAGLFAQATTSTPLVSITLGGAGSKLMVVAPNAGSNMALGVTGLDTNALATRTTPFVDVAIAANIDVLFNGGTGADVFTGDVAGWANAAILPKGWGPAAGIATVVGAAFSGSLTANGGAGDDTLAGGAGTNTLLGGAGNDTFLQGATPRAEIMNGGDGIDIVDYSVRTLPVRVTVGANTAIQTIAVTGASSGTGYVVGDVLTITGGKLVGATVTVATVTSGVLNTVTLTTPGSGYAIGTAIASSVVTGVGTGATFAISAVKADDGDIAGAEGDAVGANIEIVKGGSGDDVLNAYPITTTDVVLLGNGGNDSLTGGSGNDDLCGGAGDDTFYENPGNDNLVGGAGTDTADYSAGTGVVACLGAADQVASKPCATQNGATGEKDVVNATLAKVCPRATLTADVGGVPTAAVAVPATIQGAAMAIDVENLTGNPAAANALYCGTLACTLFGGSAADTLWGGAATDIIVGKGGADTVKTNGSADLVDFTHTGGALTQTLDCNNNAVTVLIPSADTQTFTGCGSANIP